MIASLRIQKQTQSSGKRIQVDLEPPTCVVPLYGYHYYSGFFLFDKVHCNVHCMTIWTTIRNHANRKTIEMKDVHKKLTSMRIQSNLEINAFSGSFSFCPLQAYHWLNFGIIMWDLHWATFRLYWTMIDITVLHCFPMDHWSLNILSTLIFHFFANDRGYVTKKIIYMTSSIHLLQY